MCPSFSDLHSLVRTKPARLTGTLLKQSQSLPVQCITHCDSLAQTQWTVTSQLSTRFRLLSISFITACLFHVCHHCLGASDFFLSPSLTVSVASSTCLLLLQAINLFPSNCNTMHPLHVHYLSPRHWSVTCSLLGSHAHAALLHDKPTFTFTNM